jgi:plastocyanin
MGRAYPAPASLSAAGRAPRKATKPGTFPYYCTIHAGQNGVLVVTPR